MIPEVINWDAVRCLSIEGAAIRFLEGDIQHEIVFPNEHALHDALRRWTIDSGKPTDFFRCHDFKDTSS